MTSNTAKTRKVGAMIAGVLALALGGTSCSFDPGVKPEDRMINLGFEDVVVNDAGHVSDLARKINSVDPTAVSISVGRTDWAAFPWAAREDSVSDPVQATGRDYVNETITALRPSPSGKDRDIVLTIDVLLGRALDREPALAGISPEGEISESFPGIAALRSGNAGRKLIEMATEVASRYKPTAINLTELMFDEFTFGPRDLADFKTTTGARDWPRTAENGIDTGHETVIRWRTEAMSDLVERLSAAVKPFGVALEMDVRAPLVDATKDRADSGQDYERLLQSVARLHLWDYMGLRRDGAPGTKELVQAAENRAPGRISLSIGLWSDDGVISPEQFGQALQDASAGGSRSVSVTPASLMTDGHWKKLHQAWGQ